MADATLQLWIQRLRSDFILWQGKRLAAAATVFFFLPPCLRRCTTTSARNLAHATLFLSLPLAFHFFVLAGHPNPCWASGSALGLVYWRLASQVWERKKIAKPLKSTKKGQKILPCCGERRAATAEMPQSRSRCYAHAPATTTRNSGEAARRLAAGASFARRSHELSITKARPGVVVAAQPDGEGDFWGSAGRPSSKRLAGNGQGGDDSVRRLSTWWLSSSPKVEQHQKLRSCSCPKRR